MAKAKTRDEQIKDLLKVVEEKKKKINKAEKPKWLTNCSFSFNPEYASTARVNLQVTSDINILVEIFAYVLEKREFYYKSASELGIKNPEFKWMGFTTDEWKSDIQTRIDKIQISKERQELEVLEQRLNKLVTPEERARIELQEIESLLKK